MAPGHHIPLPDLGAKLSLAASGGGHNCRHLTWIMCADLTWAWEDLLLCNPTKEGLRQGVIRVDQSGEENQSPWPGCLLAPHAAVRRSLEHVKPVFSLSLSLSLQLNEDSMFNFQDKQRTAQ